MEKYLLCRIGKLYKIAQSLVKIARINSVNYPGAKDSGVSSAMEKYEK